MGIIKTIKEIKQLKPGIQQRAYVDTELDEDSTLSRVRLRSVKSKILRYRSITNDELGNESVDSRVIKDKSVENIDLNDNIVDNRVIDNNEDFDFNGIIDIKDGGLYIPLSETDPVADKCKIYFNTTDSYFYYYDGIGWRRIVSSKALTEETWNIVGRFNFADGKLRISQGTSLPTYDNQEGDLFYRTDTQVLYIYTGGTWQKFDFAIGGTTYAYIGEGIAINNTWTRIDVFAYKFDAFPGRSFQWFGVFRNQTAGSVSEWKLVDVTGTPTDIQYSTISVPSGDTNYHRYSSYEQNGHSLDTSSLTGYRVIELQARRSAGSTELFGGTMDQTK